MMLTAKARYAVMALADLAINYNGEVTSLEVLSKNQNIAINYLEQIFARLRKQGLVESFKGPGGGYKLARPQHTISIYDIITAVNEPLKITRCDDGLHTSCLGKQGKCLTHNIWAGLSNQIDSFLKSVNLSNIRTQNIMGYTTRCSESHSRKTQYIENM
jgi:Rrf2 family iron-sulfur cluster assembly transcriptional regulator